MTHKKATYNFGACSRDIFKVSNASEDDDAGLLMHVVVV